MSVLKMQDLDLSYERVLIREDLNVPIKEGRVMNTARIDAAIPTIKKAIEQHAAVMIMSHLGRPKEGEYEDQFSLAPVADILSEKLKQPVHFVKDWVNGIDIIPGETILCENVRFNTGEKENDADLANRMANLCDVFVMDAFGSAHRAQASTHGVAKYATRACAGPLLVTELEALTKALQKPEKPVLAIVGGAKVSTKLGVLQALINKVDVLITGGGIANTFLAAVGFSVGQSLYEADRLNEAKQLLEQAKKRGVMMPLPTDVMVAKEFSDKAQAQLKKIDELDENDMILDVGPETQEQFVKLIKKSKTILWNGPVGVFEFPQFAKGTQGIGEAIARHDAFSIAGGGDTLAAIDLFKIRDGLSYISTGGGAFLKFIEGKSLPAVAILEQRAEKER